MKQTVTHFATKEAINSETPKWAKNLFRITFILTTAFAFFMAGTNLFEEAIKFEILLALKSLDLVIYGVSKLFGVTLENPKEED